MYPLMCGKCCGGGASLYIPMVVVSNLLIFCELYLDLTIDGVRLNRYDSVEVGVL